MNPISKFDEKKNRVPKQIIRRLLSLALVLTMLFSVLPLLSVSTTETLSLAAGDYLRLDFDAPSGENGAEPRFDPADIPSKPYREVVDAVQFLTDGGYSAVTLCVTGHPAMNYDDSLSLYDIEDGRLADAPFARNVGIGMTAAIDFSRQGVALVRESSTRTAERSTTRAFRRRVHIFTPTRRQVSFILRSRRTISTSVSATITATSPMRAD